MAEALVAVSLASSIVQFVDFSTKIIARLEDYHTSAGNSSGVFESVSIQLQLVSRNLGLVQKQAQAGNVDVRAQQDVNAVVQGCQRQLQRLDVILNRLEPTKGESRWRRGMKIFMSVHQEEDIKEITRCIEGYVLHLIHHQALQVPSPTSIRPTPHRAVSFSTVPFPRDPYFTGRDNQLRQVSDLLQRNGRAALYGLGGIGKSQIAIEYSHRFRDMDPGAIVLWVYASSLTRIEEAYRDIASKAQLPGYDDPSVSKFELVKNWLKEDASTSWLMIVDNADTEDTFFGPIDMNSNDASSKTVASFIPNAPNGRALITTRNRMVATRFTHRNHTIEVPRLSDEEGRQMLENAAGSDKVEDEDEVKRLLKALEYLPLAISQAAAYIDAHDITIAEYLDCLNGGDHDLVEMLKVNIADSRRDEASLNSVVASWKLSYDYLRAKQPLAADLLSLMSMLDGKAVPERLIVPRKRKDRHFIEAIGVLKSFSLLQEDRAKKVYTIHRLIHLATRSLIEVDGDTRRFHQLALAAVDDAYPTGEVEEWRECSELEPHAEAVLTIESKDLTYQSRRSNLLMRSARNRYHQYQFEIALTRATKAHEIRCALSSDRSVDTRIAEALQLISWCRFGKSEYAQAITTSREALSIYEKHCGSDAEPSLRIRSNISKFLTKQGNLKEAYDLQVTLLELQRHKLGESHEDVLFTMNRMVNTLKKQRRHSEALQMAEAMVMARRKASGDNRGATLSAMVNYATILYKVGKINDALVIMEDAYERQATLLGDNDPATQESKDLVEQYRNDLRDESKVLTVTKDMNTIQLVDSPPAVPPLQN